MIHIRFNEITKNPFWDAQAPFEITVKARKLKKWDMERIVNEIGIDKKTGEGLDQRQIDCGAAMVKDDFIFIPKLPDQSFINKNLGAETDIVLVPYGCTTTRLTVFPKYIKDMINHFDFLGDEK